jgi:hypothetical protein
VLGGVGFQKQLTCEKCGQIGSTNHLPNLTDMQLKSCVKYKQTTVKHLPLTDVSHHVCHMPIANLVSARSSEPPILEGEMSKGA